MLDGSPKKRIAIFLQALVHSLASCTLSNPKYRRSFLHLGLYLLIASLPYSWVPSSWVPISRCGSQPPELNASQALEPSIDDCRYGCFYKSVVLLVGVLLIRALLLGVYIGAPDFGKLPLVVSVDDEHVMVSY